MKNNVSTKETTTYSSRAEFEAARKITDTLVDIETARRISAVSDSEKYGIMTACYINGDFILISDYEISDEMEEALKNA